MDSRSLYPILYRDHIILVIYWASCYIQLYRLIGNMHVLEGCRMPEFELDIKYSFKGFTSDNGVLYDEEGLLKRTHSKSLEKLDKAGLNLKQK